MSQAPDTFQAESEPEDQPAVAAHSAEDAEAAEAIDVESEHVGPSKEEIDRYIDELENVKLVIGSWLSAVPRNKYTSMILSEVEGLAVEAATLSSNIDQAETCTDPEVSVVGGSSTVQSVTNLLARYRDLAEAVQPLLVQNEDGQKPSKAPKCS
eukprot:4120212-Pyramimonas_sp.AAC.1